METISSEVQLLKPAVFCKTDKVKHEQLLKKIRRDINMCVGQITKLQDVMQSKEKKLVSLFAEEKRLLSALKNPNRI